MPVPENQNVRFVGVDDGFAPAKSVAFLNDFGVTYDQFVDADGALAEDLEISELPATVVLDADGEIAARESGVMSYDELLAALDNVECERSTPLSASWANSSRWWARGRRVPRRCGCGDRT